ncbi:MAG: sodium/solute symporter, partial [Candidatus Omnitrophica bacterium]|nr:sodium/solute symporter [Candidatus Omnitrophota bacterium]
MRNLFALLLAALLAMPAFSEAEGPIEWRPEADLPGPLSGHLLGNDNGTLIVVAGTNFPVSLFDGGEKEWYSKVYVLEPGATEWTEALDLGHSVSYGVGVSTPDGMVCVGGSDGERNYADVFRLAWRDGKLTRTDLPSLPKPCAMMGAAYLESSIYVAGGLEDPKATQPLKTFWRLDLSSLEPAWEELEPWPGKARFLPAAAAQSGSFFLFSGADLIEDGSGEAKREYLTDGFRFTPGKGWTETAPLEKAVVAAPTVAYGQHHILVASGDDGALADQIQELKDNHPGFTDALLAYHTVTDTWTQIARLPVAYVTTQAVPYEDGVVIAGGEDWPGHRSKKVLWFNLVHRSKTFSMLDYATLGVYLALLVGMGFYFSRTEHDTTEFFLAGRRIPWWAAGLSIFGTQLSAITFLSMPANAFVTDWTYFLVNMTIIACAPVVAYCFLPFFRGLDLTTAYEYLERRFGLGARIYGSLSFIFFQMGRMGIVLFLPALALSAATGVNINYCILAMGVLATVYTFLGGMAAVIWTDVAQVVVLMGGALLCLGIIGSEVDGGFANLFSVAYSQDKFHMFDWTWDHAVASVWVVIVGQFVASAVPYCSDQTVIQRYLTTTSEEKARQAIWTNAFMTLPATLTFCLLGTALYVFYQEHPGDLDPTLKTDATLPLFIVQNLPAGIAGLDLAGIFAASMSSLDSSL